MDTSKVAGVVLLIALTAVSWWVKERLKPPLPELTREQAEAIVHAAQEAQECRERIYKTLPLLPEETRPQAREALARCGRP
jgi:hypothetical protein